MATTANPVAASRSVITRPMPRLAPVTTARSGVSLTSETLTAVWPL